MAQIDHHRRKVAWASSVRSALRAGGTTTFADRWTAPDPLGDKGGDPDWYGYCLDDPVNGVDPLGLAAALPMPGMPLLAPVFFPGTPENDRFVSGTVKGLKGLWEGITETSPEADVEGDLYYEEHSKRGSNSPSNRPKHEQGKRRKKQDAPGGEKGGIRRPYRRK